MSKRRDNGAGGRTVQAIYQRFRGEVVKDDGGKPVVIGWRYKGYDWVWVGGERYKVSGSVEMSSNTETAKSRAKAELAALLLKQKQGFTRITDAENRTADIEAETQAVDEEIEQIQTDVADGLATLEQARLMRAGERRLKSLTIACARYLADKDRVRAGVDTRRIYESYWRNHIAAPTDEGGTALGDLPLSEITHDRLREWERSMYRDRQGYRLTVGPRDAAIADYVRSGSPLPIESKAQAQMSPRSFAKVWQFVSAVVEWALSVDRKAYDLSYNDVAKYRPVKRETQSRKQFAPRTDLYKQLVAKAEELDMQYMIPFMALVRHSFRPAEARGIRWCDVTVRNVGDKERAVIKITGTLKQRKGGERWIAEAKTDASFDEVTLASSTYETLNAYRVVGAKYVVPPAPGSLYGFLNTKGYLDGWKRLCEAVGAPADTDPYSLKHGMIAELLLAGHTVDEVMLMTRHTTRQMVERIYAVIQSGDLADTIDRLTA